MARLTPDIRRLISEQRLAFVATVNRDGTPNLSPKGTIEVWDDEHLFFADIRSPGTVSNLARNPALEANVVDQFLRKGYRFGGTAEVLSGGPIFNEALTRLERRGPLSSVRNIVRFQVDTALPLISPIYDRGLTEHQVRETWWRYWETVTMGEPRDTPSD